jgi:hypothetical protein
MEELESDGKQHMEHSPTPADCFSCTHYFGSDGYSLHLVSLQASIGVTESSIDATINQFRH